MPTPLPVWKRTDKWKPASPGGGSQGFSVECPATGELGHCKPISYAQEVLASALANEIGVPVPSTQLGNCEDKTVAVSKIFGSKSLDVRALKATSPEAYASDAFKAAVREASGLLPFHSWLGTGDMKDDHVVVRPKTEKKDDPAPATAEAPATEKKDDPPPAQGEYEVAAIDFADAFSFDATGGIVSTPPGPPVLMAPEHRDADKIRDTIERIAAVPDGVIQSAVASIPDEALPPPDKERITKGLIARKTKVETAFRSAGWLPLEGRSE